MDSWYGREGKSLTGSGEHWDGKSAISGSWGGSAKAPAKRCYHDHPPLELPGGLKIYGGSCSAPAVPDADVYIGFDYSMNFTQRAWPWKKGSEFLFEVTDYRAPADPAEFKKLVDWTIKQLKEGKKVHAGCIGGHGRTGTFFAALAAKLGEKDAINYVRERYCKRAVESAEQIKFLAKHFGVETKGVKGAKSPMVNKSTKGVYKGGKGLPLSSGLFDDSLPSPRNYSPMRSAKTNIWEKAP